MQRLEACGMGPQAGLDHVDILWMSIRTLTKLGIFRGADDLRSGPLIPYTLLALGNNQHRRGRVGSVLPLDDRVDTLLDSIVVVERCPL